MSIKKLTLFFALYDKNDNSKSQNGKNCFPKKWKKFCHICHIAIFRKLKY